MTWLISERLLPLLDDCVPDAPAEAVLAHRERAQLAEAGAELAEGGAANDLAPRDRDREVGEPFPQRGRGPVQQSLRSA